MTMTSHPLVSVIVPAYNAEAFLGEAVASATAQTHGALEIIIIDDGSTDRTGDIADQLARSDDRLTVLHRTNGGLSAARNTGLRVARGDYIGFLDADDVFLPQKIEKQVAFLRANPEFELVYADLYLGDAHLQPMGLRRTGIPPLPFPELLVYRNWFPPIVPLLTAALVRRVGLFDETLPAVEDWDYWIRCAGVAQFGYLPEPLALYRYHPGQMSRQSERMRAAQQQVIDKHFSNSAESHRRARGARHLECAMHSKRQPLVMVRELAEFVRVVRNWRDIGLMLKVVE